MDPTAAARFDVPSADLLQRLVSEPLPLHLRGTPPERVFYRDLYFDTAEQSLEREGVWCRLRYRSDDLRELTVAFGAKAEGSDRAQVFHADLQDIEAAAAFAGATEPARRLRAFVDPARLRVGVELQTVRWTRLARPWWSKRPRFELAYDLITVSTEAAGASYQELAVRRLRTGRPRLARLAQWFQERYAVQPVVLAPVERARQVLRDLEADALARAVQASREVTVLALEQDHIALRCEGGALKLPVTVGTGEEACRRLMRECFGSAEGQVRVLATAAASATRPILEVWLARKLHGGLTCCDGANLEWLSLAEVMKRVGSPALRDPRTLTALTVAARSDFMPEWPATAGGEATARPSAAPAPVDSPHTRRVLDALRQPTLPQPALDPGRRDAEQFINAELSGLEFQARVLALAEDPHVPLLERLRFLSIVSANLDEFFMVRVGALKEAVAEGRTTPGIDGLAPQEQLDAIAIRASALAARVQRCLERELLPALAAQGIEIRRWSELADAQRAALRRYFTDQVFPLLTPHAVTRAPGHAFPRIRHLTLSLATLVRDPRTGPIQLVLVQLPAELPRFVPLGDDGTFVPLEEIVRANLESLYPGRQVDSGFGFRVTRRRDIQVDELGAGNLLQAVQEEMVRRPFGRVVRLEVERAMPGPVRQLLLRELRFERGEEVSTLGPADIYDADGLLEHRDLSELAALARPNLRYPSLQPHILVDPARPIFEALAERDLLVHHPYDSFEATVQRFLVEAADDPAVRSIRLTLYRTGGQSPIADALLRAAGRGKEVAVFVEVKARFDEERNIDWARRLEAAGIHVVYGLPELKMHAKVALVARRERLAVRRYVHIGTGNYNADTARAYTDLGLLSANPALGAEVNDLFNELTGSGKPPLGAYRRLLVAPTDMRTRFIALIARETEHTRAGRGGRIRAKLNGLSDPEIIAALYRASQAGVRVALVVRGICGLRPGVPGLSERIRVVSIVGRFLEHARIYAFDNAGQPEYFIGSADWRPRNLSRRVEVVTLVRDPAGRGRLEHILTTELEDPTAWVLESDGSYSRRPSSATAPPRSAQERFLEERV